MSYKDWAIRDFSAGRIDRIDDNLLPDNAAKDCQNVISRRVGSLVKRPGQQRFHSTALLGAVNGLYPYYVGIPVTSRHLVVSAAGQVGTIQTGTFNVLKQGLNANAPYFFETCVNYMVAANGVDAPWKWDGTTVSALANAPADGMYPTLHKEKLFMVPKSDPSLLKWSDSTQPELWPSVNYWAVKDGDGDEITCLVKHIGELVIFKRRSIHGLRGTSLDDFRLDELDEKVGCVGPRAAIKEGIYIYFVSEQGLHVFNGVKTTNLSKNMIPFLWENINQEYLHNAVVGSWRGLIWFALPEGTSTVNNLLLLYVPSEEGGSFWPCRAINASCFQSYFDGTELMWLSGDSGAGFVNRQDIGTDDFGNAIDAYWIGKGFDMGNPSLEKKAKRLFLEKSPNTTTAPTLLVSLDYGTFNTILNERGDSLVEQYKLTGVRKWRYFTPKLQHSSLGDCEVRGILVPFKSKTRPKVRRGG